MLATKIQIKLGAAMSGKLAEAAQSIKLKRIVLQVDKVRGEAVESVEEFSGRGLCRLSWSSKDIAALNILQTDGKAIILQNELAAAPKIDDLIDFGDGDHRIIFVRQDPVAAIWVVQYRKA